MRYAVIDAANNVINAIELDDIGTWQPPAGSRLIASDVAGPGWTYNGTTFVPPPGVPLTPEEQAAVDARAAREARRALLDAQSDQAELYQQLRNATPAQIDSWLLANVTNLVQARAVLGAIIKYLAKSV